MYGTAATFPYGTRFPKLDVSGGSFEVIFSGSKRPLDNDTSKATLIEGLVLDSMNRLKYIWDRNCQADHTLQNLKTLEVRHCARLITLGPSFVSLQNLTDLVVSRCNKLINLLTPSTARTLVQLTRLKIEDCGKIEEIITNDQEIVEKEIHFMKLKILELDGLSSCKSFCCHNYSFEFQTLDEVIIKGCPRLRIFCPGELTTPLLKLKMGGEEIHCQNNLNERIQQLFDKKVKIRREVKIDEYPELIDIRNGKCAVSNWPFSKLISLIMDKCDFLSNQVMPFHILTSLINLKRLEVSNCDSVEVVFDLEGIHIDKEARTLQAIPLRYIRLDHLPNLKYIWNKDPHPIRFQHLYDVSACECQSLRSIFPASVAKGLTNLWCLKIKSCGVEVIVAENETPAQTVHFVFPWLFRLDLVNLSNLKNFCPQRHTVECPMLRYMDVRLCKKLKVFSWEGPNIAEKEAKNEIENQYLFSFEKVVPMLYLLALNKEHIKIISNGQFQDNLFNNVRTLVLDGLDENESPGFLFTFLERFTKLWALDVSHSCFKVIFPHQGSPSDFSGKLPLLTSITLTHLDQLQNIWNEDFQIHPFLQNLRELHVNHCSHLIKLAPSYASFDNLRKLKMSGCHHLGHILTISIAKSLVCLQSLVVEDCKMMEEVVTNEGEDVEDLVVLKMLKDMELINLPVLKNFCSQICTFEFPSLTNVTIKRCFKMKMFCPGVLIIPLLKNVKIEENEEHWEGNLNKTLEQLFLEKEGQNSSKS